MQRRDIMNIGSLVIAVNNLADEDFSSTQIVQFVNDAIARINIECQANFPEMNVEDSSEYPGFPNKWQRALFVPFVVGRMKAVDASQFEYNDNYSEFLSNLAQFKVKFPVPDAYKDTNESVSFEPDFTGNAWSWGGSDPSDPFGNGGNSSSDGGEF
jgi:hypothetical protein